MDRADLDEELRRRTVERVRAGWAIGAALQLGFWLLDLLVVPERRWLFLGLRLGLVGIYAIACLACLAARSRRAYRAWLLTATLAMGAVVPTMTFFMGGFGGLYTFYAPLTIYSMAVVVLWTARDGAIFLGASLAYYALGNGLLLAAGTGTAAEAVGGLSFVGTACVISFLTILFNERSVRAELLLREDLRRSHQELLASVQVLGEREGRLAAIGGVTSAFVHDVRNPLSSILSLSQNAMEDAREGGNEELAGDMEAVVASGQRLRALFEQVQAFARAEGPPLEPERVGLAALTEASLVDLVRPLRSQGISLTFQSGDCGAAEVIADRAAMRRVLEQLVRNSARAIANRRAGGELAEGRIRVEAARAGRRVQLRVVDDGCGLSPAVRDRLFRPFASAGPEAGHGLGLAVARSLVRAQGGELSTEEPAPAGGGAAFTVTLPLAPQA